MKMTKKILNTSNTFIALIFISINVSASECPKNRDDLFNNAFNGEKARIMELPEYTSAHNRFTRYLKEIEEFKKAKEQEMRNDQEYQKNFDTIRSEIQRSGTLHNDLSAAERAHLINALTKQFIPD